MISSMTGFGSATLENEKISLNIHVKSVNGRFFESRFRMPREYSALENELKKILNSQITRGTVDVAINRSLKLQDAAGAVEANVPMAKACFAAAQEVAQALKLQMPSSVEWVLKMPDVLQMAESGEIPDWEKDAVIQTLQNALKACVAERKREGEAQYKTFTGLLDSLEKFVDGVKKRKTQLDAELSGKLKERLKQVDGSVNVDPARLAQEVVFMLDKADVAEEIARAETHIKAYRQALRENSSVGKKLEFYTQELHREVNTMGSKTQALDVTLDIIEAKTSVERLREQVQNVE